MDIFSESMIEKCINSEVNLTGTSYNLPTQVYSPIPFAEAKEMLYNCQERGKARPHISLVQQYIKQVFPHNIDHRQLFLFLAFELRPGFEELAFLLQKTVEALELPKQDIESSKACVKSNVLV